MPIIRAAKATTEQPEHPHPVLGNYTAKLFSDSGGLDQFGAFTETLPPGSKSSQRHWHQNEDEMIYMLSGMVIVHEGDAATPLHPGDSAAFKAGVPIGHYLENTSDSAATYLVIGTRADSDVVTYPDHDCVLHFDRTTGERRYVTLDGQPTVSPY
ncbi:cupin [Loktanella sp. D2R18]|uniref:cupin domain-containing protein n=1 Tax=Rhodobacterales TaxID=204455 RepID=UPI000DE9302A|nr:MULTISPECIES: cupin domain-containing protein [Rhodobacterales]MDO6589227.1 cupin domain-containing protein [Yoonia sp. 1_MG-2023]RBW45347.1 cupin [Loktanella sp. D2R18]